MTLRLHHDWDSVCSFKVRMCLAEKGIAWESVRVDLNKFEHLQSEYLKYNPNGVVPTLEHAGAVIIESSVINEYVDETLDGPALSPESLVERATMRIWVKYQDDVLYHAQRPATFQLMVKKKLAALSEDEVEQMVRWHPQPQRARHFVNWATGPVDEAVVAEAKSKVNEVFQRLEDRLREREWLAGDAFTLAECAYAPFIDRIERLKFDDLWREMPNVRRWAARIKERPAFAASRSPAEHEMPGPE